MDSSYNIRMQKYSSVIIYVNHVKHNVKITKQLSQHHSKSAVKTVVRMNKRLGGGGVDLYQVFISF